MNFTRKARMDVMFKVVCGIKLNKKEKRVLDVIIALGKEYEVWHPELEGE